MRKNILLTIITVSLIFSGCGKAVQTNSSQKKNESASVTTTTNTTAEASTTKAAAGDAGNYNQYTKKRWIKKNDTNNNSEVAVSFSISKIENGKITGKLNAVNSDSTDDKLLDFESDFEGTVNKSVADCRYSDKKGDKGNIKLAFKASNHIEATITITEKSNSTIQPVKGTFEFSPDNIKYIKGFSSIESQSFMVNLNSWGNVKFVSGKLTAGKHVPLVFYLTNKDGDILYNFNATLPYNVDVKAVSFQDVNKDKLKDVIIIAAGKDSSVQVAAVYLQKSDGSFVDETKLDSEINDSGNNKDIKTVVNYLSKKF